MRIAPTHKAFDAYETTLADYRDRKVSNEGAVRFAFQTLLTTLAPARWNVLGEQTLANGIRPDGVLKDGYNLTRGYWEAKDTGDDLDEEIRKKIAKGYSTRTGSRRWMCRSPIASGLRICSRSSLRTRSRTSSPSSGRWTSSRGRFPTSPKG